MANVTKAEIGDKSRHIENHSASQICFGRLGHNKLGSKSIKTNDSAKLYFLCGLGSLRVPNVVLNSVRWYKKKNLTFFKTNNLLAINCYSEKFVLDESHFSTEPDWHGVTKNKHIFFLPL